MSEGASVRMRRERSGTRRLDVGMLSPIARDRVAHYMLEELLGEGALGEVYRARDTKMNRTVALKVLSDAVENRALRDRFHLEARAIAALKHPNVVNILDYSDAEADPPYIALESLTGVSLQDRLEQNGPLPEQLVVCIMHEMVSGLEHAHSQNIVHRDIKPANIVLEFGRVVLIDFGAMKVLGAHETVPGTTLYDERQAVGTPGFMAPEQYGGQNIDHRADIFGVGATLYFLTTGQTPYDVDDDLRETIKNAKRNRYTDPRSLQPLLSPAFCDLLADCLTPSPRERLDTAGKLRERLHDLIRGHGIRDYTRLISAYAESPGSIDALDQRSTAKLIHELRIALMRDFQNVVKQGEQPDIDQCVKRLQAFETFDASHRLKPWDRRRKPSLLCGRRPRKKRWLALALCVGLLMGLGGVSLGLLAAPERVLRLREKIATRLGLSPAP